MLEMLVIILLFAFYAFLQKFFVDWPAKRRITKLHSTAESVALRDVVRRHRRILLNIFILLVFISRTALSALADFKIGHVEPNNWGWLFIFPAMIWLYLRGERNYERLIGRISVFDKNRFLAEHDDFVLFLRGFASDDYSTEGQLERKAKKLKQSRRFSEYAFTKILGQRRTVCAIGMTKEISSPIGAVRIYVDDETWQQDVRDLMERAKAIYILVNDSSSCIWEICESGTWLSKSVLLVDDLEKYERVRSSGSICSFVLPELPNPSKDNHKKKQIAAISFVNDTSSISQFDNTIDGYARYLCRSPPKKERNLGCNRGCLCVAMSGLLLLFVISWFKVGRDFNKDLAARKIIEEYKVAEGIVGELPVRGISEEISIVQPSGMELVESGTEQFSSHAQTVLPPFSAKVIYVRMGEVNSDAILSAEIADVSEWTNRMFTSSLEFKRQIETEKRGLLSTSTPKILTVSEASRTGFQWALLREEGIILQGIEQSCFSMFVCRMSRIGDRCVLFRWWQVFRTEKAALEHAKSFENNISQWADVSQAVNHKTQTGKKKGELTPHSPMHLDDKHQAKGKPIAIFVPFILFILAIAMFLKR